MDSLANYGSDDDFDDDSNEKQQDWNDTGAPLGRRLDPSRDQDANYEEVQMDLSEGSNDSKNNSPRYPRTKDDYSKNRDADSKHNSRQNDYRDGRTDKDTRYNSRDRERSQNSRRERSRSRDRHSRSKSGDTRRSYSRDNTSSRDSTSRRRSDSRDNTSRRRSESRDNSSRSRDSTSWRRSDRRRSGSRERDNRRSKSPRRDRDRRSRSRSRSRDRYRGGRGRYDRSKRMGKFFKTEEQKQKEAAAESFQMPGATGRFRDQIERRKLLWQKGKEPEKEAPVATTAVNVLAPGSSRATKVWEGTTFAQDSDGEKASKFKRLMGIKTAAEEKAVPTVDILKKQQELFSTMEQQYEVARTTTHTMRGVGLGFGSRL